MDETPEPHDEPMTADWSDLYRAVYPDLVRFLNAKVWDGERAQELAQEVFVRALKEEPLPERPRSWLFTVAANLARDEARTVLRRKRHLVLLKGEMSETTGGTPAEELERREQRDGVRRALSSLGERDREVLLLWDAGLNYNEISQHTGLAVGAIGTTLARARRRLVEAYHEEEREDVARP